MLNHPIDPLIDCVFKALFGDPTNKEVLVSFINDITRLNPSIVDVEILNPYSPEEFVGDDLRIVDVRARDAAGAQYQIEVQLVVQSWLSSRILYTWADLYQGQLQRGEHFRSLRPVIAIWVLLGNLLPASERWHHRFRLWDHDAGVLLTDHLDLHTVELRKWRLTPAPLAPDEAWVYFLREARHWVELPPSLRTPVMEKAMSVLERFSEKGEDYHRYQARMNALREAAAMADERAEMLAELSEIKQELEESKQELEESKQELEESKQELEESKQELAGKELALARMRERLRALGIDPDAL